MVDSCTHVTPLEKAVCAAVSSEECKQTLYTTQCTTWNAISLVFFDYVQ